LEGTSVLWDSLAHNAYGIYLVHYFFVNWLQYLFLQAANPRLAKGLIVIALESILSWAAIAVLRRIPAVARLIYYISVGN
jgi:surface polysaccharide O-acyltransferase-like enzyme